jgi:uncharacterized protein (UPF0333 family)
MSMNTKVITGGIIVIIIIIAAIYWMSKNGPTQSPATTKTANAATALPTASSTLGKCRVKTYRSAPALRQTPGSQVSVLYVGKLQDGTVFDSSAAHNNKPLVFTLGHATTSSRLSDRCQWHESRW